MLPGLDGKASRHVSGLTRTDVEHRRRIPAVSEIYAERKVALKLAVYPQRGREGPGRTNAALLRRYRAARWRHRLFVGMANEVVGLVEVRARQRQTTRRVGGLEVERGRQVADDRPSPRRDVGFDQI